MTPRASGYCGARGHGRPKTLSEFRAQYPQLDETTLRIRHRLYLEHWQREHPMEAATS